MNLWQVVFVIINFDHNIYHRICSILNKQILGTWTTWQTCAFEFSIFP